MLRTRQPNILIFLAGLFSSAIALVLVTIVNLLGFNLMGLHVAFVLPLGAILVGLVAGTGYALGSRIFNVKIQPAFLLVVVALAVVTYGLAHAITYAFMLRQFHLSALDFTPLDYIRQICEEASFRSTRRPSSEPVRLGVWGYLIQLLELGGFTVGTITPALLLASKPYCENCQLYMGKLATFYHPSTLEQKDWKAVKGKKERQELLEQAAGQALESFSAWWSQVYALPWEMMEAQLDSLNRTSPKKALAFTQSDLHLCDGCDHWDVITQLASNPGDASVAFKPIHDSRNVPRVAPAEPPPPPPPPYPPGGEQIQEGR